MKTSGNRLWVNFGAPALLVLLCSGLSTAQADWATLADGLDLGRFKVQQESSAGDSLVTVLRIDPKVWELKLVSASQTDAGQSLTAREWCNLYGLTAAVNAGMFNSDNISHTGYMKCGDRIYNSTVNSYRSVAAFNPSSSDLVPFHVFDTDDTDIATIQKSYACVIQNLRLIDRQRTNRWSPQEKRWSEAALGEDSQGRVLFIYCRSPYSMFELNEILLSLPLDLVCAQHLEGGPEAQLYVHSGKTELELAGGYESDFHDGDDDGNAWPVPNVLGVVKRK